MTGLIKKIRELNGEPRYVARGMAVGFFVGVTPTIPFHTMLAVLLALTFRGSKPAAIIGAWVANPFTIPIFYLGSYHAGLFLFVQSVAERPDIRAIVNLLEQPLSFIEIMHAVNQFIVNNLDVAWKILAGGLILGIVPALLSYALTLNMCRVYSRTRKKKEFRL